jgi:hypothetical protein
MRIVRRIESASSEYDFVDGFLSIEIFVFSAARRPDLRAILVTRWHLSRKGVAPGQKTEKRTRRNWRPPQEVSVAEKSQLNNAIMPEEVSFDIRGQR